MSRSRHKDAGLTLLELMVSVLLAMMLTGGLFYMMSAQQKSYATQMSSMDAQENLWGAMEYISNELRKAGYGFGGCPPDPTLGYNAPVVQMWNQVAGCSPTPSGCIRPDRYFVSFLSQNATRTYPPVKTYNGNDGPDSFYITYVDDNTAGTLVGLRLAREAPEASSFLTLTSPGNVKIGDLLILWQHGTPRHCTVLEATSVPVDTGGGSGPYQVQYDPIAGGVYNPPGGQHDYLFPTQYTKGALVMNAGSLKNRRERHFSIDDSGSAPDVVPQLRPPRLVAFDMVPDPLTGYGNPKLANKQVIAYGIEDMQIAWACDRNADGILEEGNTDAARQTDEWAFNVAQDTPPVCSELYPLTAVRVTLVARTTGAVISKVGFRPAAEDRAAGTPADDQLETDNMGTFARAVLTSTIKPRNLRRSVQ